MLKRLISSGPVVALGSSIGAAYIRLVYATSEVRRDPPDTDAKLFAEHPQIFAMWHGQFGMLPKIKPDRPADVAAMVARHGDAELISGVLKRFGMTLIRGAGAGPRRRNRGGAAAFRGALKALQQGTTVAMTADFAPGPARRTGDGIVMLGQISGRPIVPCAMATSRFFARQVVEQVYRQPPLLHAWHRGRRSGMGASRRRRRGAGGGPSRRGARAEPGDRARLPTCGGHRSIVRRDATRRGDTRIYATRLSGADVARGAHRAADARLAHPPRQGRGAAAPGALWRGWHAPAARLPRLVSCRERRRDQCRVAGDRCPRRRAPGRPRPPHHRHRDLGEARASPAAEGCHPSICAARSIRTTCSAFSPIGGRTSPCSSNPRSGRTSCSRPRRRRFPSSSSTAACRRPRSAAGARARA